MANHFPQVPNNLRLTGITYRVIFPPSFGLTPGSPFTFNQDPLVAAGILSWFDAGPWGTQFTFPVAGEFGTFDQDVAEYFMAQWVGLVCRAVALVTGAPLLLVMNAISVERTWLWNTPGGHQLTYTDAMTWPVLVIVDRDDSKAADGGEGVVQH